MKRGEEREDAENGYHNGGAFWRHPAKKKGVGLNGVIFFGGRNGLRSPNHVFFLFFFTTSLADFYKKAKSDN